MPSNTEQSALRTWAAGLCVVTACLGSAQAQQVGTYVGQTADGHEVTIDVALDSNTGGYYIASLTGGFTMNCRKTGTAEEWGMSIYGNVAPIDAGHVDMMFLLNTFYLESSLDFKSDRRIAGKIRGGVPTFAGTDTPPKSAQACNSDNLRFTAEFTSAEARGTTTLAPRRATARIDRDGGQVVELSSVR